MTAAAAIVVAALLGACSAADSTPGPQIPPDITAPPPTPIATPEPTVDSALPAEIAGVDTSDWQQVLVPSGRATFRIPPDWSTSETADGVAVLRADGERQLGYAEGADTGDGRCTDASGTAVAWRTANLDRADVSLAGASDVSYGAAALQLGGQWVVSVGLLPTGQATRPQCPIVNSFEAPGGDISFGSETIARGAGEGAPWAVASQQAATQYLDSEEYRTIRAILMSLELVEG